MTITITFQAFLLNFLNFKAVRHKSKRIRFQLIAIPKPDKIDGCMKVYPLTVIFLMAADGKVNGKMFAKYCNPIGIPSFGHADPGINLKLND